MNKPKRGLLFIVSAASGTGKTTLVERLVQRVPNLCLSRSYTSRAARPGEQDGVDYNFISRPRFEEMARACEFLEWADVFGNYYGTSAADTERCLANGQDIVLVIDVQGAKQVRSSGVESVGISQRWQLAPGEHQRLLDDVLGETEIAQDPIRDRKESIPSPTCQAGERLLITGSRLLDEGRSHLRLPPQCVRPGRLP